MLSKTIIILGNGPSVRDVQFENIKIDSFGMNLAYRHYTKINWFPTYYGCYDLRHLKHNLDNFYTYLAASDNRLKTFFVPTLFNTKKQSDKIEITGLSSVLSYTFKHLEVDNKMDNYVGGTGAMCAQLAIYLGYTNIILIGMDLNYNTQTNIEKNNGWYRAFINGEVNNDCYGFDNYLQKGDTYQEPFEEIYQYPPWKHLSSWYKENGIKVVNCSSVSRIKDLFPYCSLEESGVYG